MIRIQESDMNFRSFEKKDIFYIEKSALYNPLGENVKMAEFILKKNNRIIFLGVKKYKLIS